MAIVTHTRLLKCNTITEGNVANTGLNPIMELNYGGKKSRGLIYFDTTKVKKLVEDKTYPDISKLRHVLKMTNTASIYSKYEMKPCFDIELQKNKIRATSFDVVFFLVNKDWDNGRGFDYVMDLHNGSHRGYSTDGSNWNNYRTYVKWDENGVYSTETLSREVDKATSNKGNISDIIIGFQHFDYGNENIEIDITETFNKFMNGEIENHGIGIAFTPFYEEIESDMTNYVGFFSPYTNSFFEPCIETRYEETIIDDRKSFYLDKDNKLYFYCLIGGKYTNLDTLPTCTINDTLYEVKQATKGIYYVDVNFSSDDYEVDTMYYDTWGNLSLNGKNIKDVELYFVTKDKGGFFTLGLPNDEDTTKTIPSLYGINDKERIKQGEIRRVFIENRIQYTSTQQVPVDGMEYRIYVMEGERQYDFISWTAVERGYDSNYFLIDTDNMVPNRYFIDIRIREGMELIKHLKLLQFDIVEDITNQNV